MDNFGKKVFFKLGTNMQWVELHLAGEYNSNIEVGQTERYIKSTKVPLFAPYFEQKKSEMNKILLLGGDN